MPLFDQRVFVACEHGGQIRPATSGRFDVHRSEPPCARPARCTGPGLRASAATRSTRSSRHGAAISCTPIGSCGACGFMPHSGTVTTGRPMHEIGCVSSPMLARAGRRWPLISSHSVPIGRRGAGRGRRDQHVDVLEAPAPRGVRTSGARAAPAPPRRRARARWPGSGRVTSGRNRWRAVRRSVEVQRAAFAAGDEERRGACARRPRAARSAAWCRAPGPPRRRRRAPRPAPSRGTSRRARHAQARRATPSSGATGSIVALRAGRVVAARGPASRRRPAPGRATLRANGPRWSRLATKG